LELEWEEAARQEAERVAKEEEKRQIEILLKQEQDQQDRLRQGSCSLIYI